MTTARPAGAPHTRRQSAALLARRALRLEVAGYRAIHRFLLRRPRVPAGATGFSHHAPVLAITVAFIVVSAVELVVVDLVVSRWPAVRVPLLVVGVWGLIWMFGLLFGLLTRPHAVGPDGILVRDGAEIDVALSWDDIETVGLRPQVATDQPKVTVAPDGRATLHLRVQDRTDIEIVLDRPVPVQLPGGTEVVHRITLHADDPRAFLAAVRQWAERRPAG